MRITFTMMIFALFILASCEQTINITSFDECVDAGYPVMESYPRKCQVPNGETFTEKLSPREDENIMDPANEDDPAIIEEEFCGLSIGGACTSDSECVVGGCSGQICQSANKEQMSSTCEYKDCYNAASYGLKCGCFEEVCQWN